MLIRSEDLKDLLFQGSSDLMLYLDASGRIIKINKAGLVFSGFSEEEVTGKMFWKIPSVFSKRNVPKYLKVFKKTLTGKETKSFLGALNDKSGKTHLMEFSIYPIKENSEIKYVLVVAKDITERKKAEELIEGNKEFLKTILENLQVGVAIVDTDTHKIVGVNPLAVKMIGAPKKKIVGKICHKFICPAEKGKCPITDLGQKIDNSERVLINSNGKKMLILKTVVPVMIDNHEYLVESFVDITDRKIAEEKIKQQNIQLEKLDRIKSNFLTVTSHELRTPMSAIKGYIQMLLKQSLGEITEEQKQALNVISRNTTRLDNLIKDILDVSRLESGTMKFITEQTDLHKMIREISETMQSSADLKNIKINVELEWKIPELVVDQERIQQVIINLLNNAIKFSPGSSIINIRVKREEDDVLFEVQDFGRGIPKDKLNKVFETFYQADSSKDLKFGGAGLGLSISRGIVLAHGGRIWVESILGKGSIFRFTLPIKPVINVEDKFKKVDIFRLKLKE